VPPSWLWPVKETYAELLAMLDAEGKKNVVTASP